jgi:hypothetical protein
MRFVAVIAGCSLLALVLTDGFNTLVLARRTNHVFRIARAYYGLTWNVFANLGRRIKSPKRRENVLAIYGPLSLLLLFGLWAAGLVFSFGLLQWASGMRVNGRQITFANDIYLSASSLFTLTNGDPQNTVSKLLSVIEGGVGLACLGLVVGYLPVLYQSFAERELAISMLDARAGSPPSASALLEWASPSPVPLEKQLAKWEVWEARLLENHLSFPMLAYFRSQHPNQSWLTALIAMIDVAAIVSLTAKHDLQRQAQLTFAMGRHALADITLVFGLKEQSTTKSPKERLSRSECERLNRSLQEQASFLDLKRLTFAELAECRKLYETNALALSEYFLMALPGWTPGEATTKNWRVPVSDRGDAQFAVSDPFSDSRQERR